MTKRRRTLPPVSPRLPAELRPMISAMTEILETGEGVRGDPLDRKLTLRDVLDSGIGKLKPGARPGADGGLQPGIQPPAPDLSTPPPPQGFAAQGSFFGMINLSWQIPSELYRNHAYTNIYRSEEDNFANAVIVGRSLGAFYSDFVRNDALDPQDPLQLKGYYYWITFTSAAEVEGPPNATAGLFTRPLPDLDYVLDLLDGQISSSQLAENLRAPIERIEVLDGAETLEGSVAYRLAQERDARIAALLEERNQTVAQITQEKNARDDQFGQIVTMIDNLEAGLDDDYSAGLTLERQARIAGDEALASDITALTAVANQNAADIISESQARATAVEAVASDVTALYATADTLEGEILDEARVRATEDELLAGAQRVISAAGEIQAASIYTLSQIRISENEVLVQEISGLEGRLGDAEGAIQNESTIRLQGDQALAQQISTLQVQVDEDFAGVQQELRADIDAVTGKINAAWTARVEANGLVGGFGLGTDGETVDAIFDVDRFAVGRSTEAARYPFIVQDGAVYMDTALIRDTSIQEGKIGPITVGKLFKPDGTPISTVGGLIRADAIDVNNLAVAEASTFTGVAQSANYVPGSSGWVIQPNGNVEFNQGVFNGQVEFRNIIGAGALASKDSLAYSDVAGTKPPTDADRTASNTAYDTARVSGSAASSVRTWALNGNNANTRVNSWARPNTTLIDGNKIFTGDAYVDTLQIRGQAVTFPRSSYAAASTRISTSYTEVQSLGFTASASGVPLQIICSITAYSGTTGVNIVPINNTIYMRVLIGGTVAWDGQIAVAHRNGNTELNQRVVATTVIQRNSVASAQTITIQARYSNYNWGGASVAARFIGVTELKR